MPTGVPAVLPERPPPSLLRTLEASEMSELCDVCGFDTEPDNLIVYCESCNIGVHQTCYGISQVESEKARILQIYIYICLAWELILR